MTKPVPLNVLYDSWEGCNRCELHKLRARSEKPVMSTGTNPADFLFVYDAPEEEDMQFSYPAQGRHGSILLDLIERAEIKNYAVLPLVGCRPYVVLPATDDQEERVQDTDPSLVSIEACSTRLSNLIYHHDPYLIFTVGQMSWKSLVRPKDRDGHTTLDKAAGNLVSTYVTGHLREVRYPVMPLLAPKNIIANPSSADHGPVATTLEAMLRAKTYVNLLRKDE